MKPAQASIMLSLVAFLLVASLASVERPNVVLILADDQGWNALSAPMDPEVAGSKSDYHKTPHTDRLMGDGMRFTDGYAPAPVCSPTRHSIQFGISPAKTRVTHNSPKYIQRCDPQLALANLVKKADGRYATVHFGKWHVSLPPSECGYDESDGSTANREGSNSDDVEDPKRTFEVTERAVDSWSARPDRISHSSSKSPTTRIIWHSRPVRHRSTNTRAFGKASVTTIPCSQE